RLVSPPSTNGFGTVRPMIRSILAIVAGLVVAIILFMAVELLGGLLFPFAPPPGVDPWTNPEAMKTHIASLPLAAFLLVLAGWFLGTFCATVLALRIARRAPAVHALILCGVLLLTALLNLLSFPHPTWFWVATFVTFPLAVAAG